MKIVGKVDMTCKILHVNTASGTTSGPLGLMPLIMNTEEHSFKHNFIICMKLKQTFIIGLDFAQRYKVDVDWDTS